MECFSGAARWWCVTWSTKPSCFFFTCYWLCHRFARDYRQCFECPDFDQEQPIYRHTSDDVFPPNSSSKGGAIAGGVVGGIAGAALIAAVVAWITVRRRRTRSALSAAAIDGQSNMGQGGVPYPMVKQVPRLYVRVLFLSADRMWSTGEHSS